jgi:hypothetical protein
MAVMRPSGSWAAAAGWLAGWLAGSGTEKQQSADLRFSINRHIDGYTLVIRVNNAYAYI